MGGYPALAVQPPQNFGDMMTRVLQLQHLQQAGQAQQIQNQMLQEEQQDDAKWRSVFSSASQHPEWTPEDYLKAGEAQGVGPRSYFTVAQGLQQHQKDLASLGQEQLKVMDGVLSKTQGYLQDVLDAPPDQKLRTQQQFKAKAINLISNAQGLNPAIQKAFLQEAASIPDDVYAGDDRMGLLMGRHVLYATQSERALKLAQTQEAAGKGAASAADAANALAKSNPQSPLYSPTPQYLAGAAANAPGMNLTANDSAMAQSIRASEAQQAGNVAGAEAKAKLPYEIQERQAAAEAAVQAQTRMYAGNTALAKVPPHLVAPATAEATKLGTDFANVSAQLDNGRAGILAAKTGDQLANSLAPIMAVLGSNSFYQTHRVAPAEANAVGPELGSIMRQVNTKLDKWGSGKLPPESQNEISALLDRLGTAASTKYKNGLAVVNANYGSAFTPVQMGTATGAGANRPPLSSFEK